MPALHTVYCKFQAANGSPPGKGSLSPLPRGEPHQWGYLDLCLSQWHKSEWPWSALGCWGTRLGSSILALDPGPASHSLPFTCVSPKNVSFPISPSPPYAPPTCCIRCAQPRQTYHAGAESGVERPKHILALTSSTHLVAQTHFTPYLQKPMSGARDLQLPKRRFGLCTWGICTVCFIYKYCIQVVDWEKLASSTLLQEISGYVLYVSREGP